MSRDFLVDDVVMRRWKRTCKCLKDNGSFCNREFWGGVRGRVCDRHYRTDGKGGRCRPLNIRTKSLKKRSRYLSRSKKTKLV